MTTENAYRPFANLQSCSRVITLSNYSLITLVFWNTCTKILYKFSSHMIIIQQILARAIRTKEYVSIISIFHATNGDCGRMKGIYICILKILLQMYLTVSMYFIDIQRIPILFHKTCLMKSNS